MESYENIMVNTRFAKDFMFSMLMASTQTPRRHSIATIVGNLACQEGRPQRNFALVSGGSCSKRVR